MHSRRVCARSVGMRMWHRRTCGCLQGGPRHPCSWSAHVDMVWQCSVNVRQAKKKTPLGMLHLAGHSDAPYVQ